jgi:hypothetical protein
MTQEAHFLTIATKFKTTQSTQMVAHRHQLHFVTTTIILLLLYFNFEVYVILV